jgi:hypothetical protein
VVEGFWPAVWEVLFDEEDKKQCILVDRMFLQQHEFWLGSDKFEVASVDLGFSRIVNAFVVVLDHLANSIHQPEPDCLVFTMRIELEEARQVSCVLSDKLVAEVVCFLNFLGLKVRGPLQNANGGLQLF